MKKAVSILLAALVLVSVFAFAGCGKKDDPAEDSGLSEVNGNVSLSDVMTKIRNDVGFGFEEVTYSAEDLMSYYGIDAAAVADFAVVVNASGYQDEIIMIKGNDDASAADISEKLNQHLEYQKEEMDGYSPEMIRILNNCSVITRGTTVALFISDKTDAMVSVFNGLVAE